MIETDAVFLPDCHVPYEDLYAWDKALRFIEDSGAEGVVLLGDFLDMYGVSRYDKAAGHAPIAEEIERGKSRLTELRRSFGGPILYCEGNHEQRLEKYITRNAAALAGLPGLTIPELLDLERYNIQWSPWGDDTNIRAEGVWVEHGDCSAAKSGYTAHAMLNKRVADRGVSAHTHRLGHVFRTVQGHTREWVEAGCLCNRDAMKYYTLYPDWQLGLAYLDRRGKLGVYSLDT